MKETDAAEGCLADSLKQLQKAGAEFFVDGEEVSLDEAVKRAVQEEHTYMADYVLSRAGKVEQVRFDRVDLQ